MTLHDVIEGFAPLLVGCGAGLAAFAFLCVAELIGKIRCRVLRGQRLRLEQYRAEQALHSIRRQAVHNMLETARTHPGTYDDVVEGTAIEVER
jgi:hypothetical protein